MNHQPEFEDALAVLAARGPGRMVPDLERITRLANLLGDPQLAYPTVHVTGTNGKTSVTRMVATLLSAAGLAAGTYTSPHLQSVRERFTVTGRWIGERALATVVDAIAPIAEMVDSERGDEVTYFEFLTACAYWWFADKPVDAAVFEVGMGGRWDATNLVRGDVAVITPIDVDHRDHLGTTAVEAAHEKAGIIKEGSRVVLADQDPEVLEILEERAAEVGATVSRWGDDIEVVEQAVAIGGQALALRVGDRTIENIALPLFGSHQASNAALALAAAAAFLGESFDQLSDDLIQAGLAAATSPGRLEVVHRDPKVVLDGAHNPHGAVAAAAGVEEAFDFRSTVLLVASLADKDIPAILDAWRDVANHVVVTAAPSVRAASVEAMAEAAAATWEGTGVVVEAAATTEAALELATGVAGPGDGVVVTGSLYTVGAVRDVYVPVTDTGDEVIEEPTELTEEEEEREFQEALDEMIDRLDDEAGE